ncbi:SAM-dependent methyltransferase [Caminibacter pacificus]|jgi:SAM-dependent methyltransferase
MALDLYAQIEELFLDKEAAHMLWGEFIEILKKLDVKSVLDVGCGSGDFCIWAKNEGFLIEGVDLSKEQVKKANEKGCDCKALDVCEVTKKYEAAVSIFDVVNYMDKNELKKFFSCVEKVIDKYYIFDINTKYAMEDLAIGTLKAEDKDRFSVLYSEFEDDKLVTEITLFTKKDENCYEKKQKSIIQYYHSIEEIEKLTSLKLEEIIPISLYGSEEAEKLILIFKK